MKYKVKPYRSRGIYRRKSVSREFRLSGMTKHPRPMSSSETDKADEMNLIKTLLSKIGFNVKH